MMELVTLLIVTLMGAILIADYYIRRSDEDSMINTRSLLDTINMAGSVGGHPWLPYYDNQIWYGEQPAPVDEINDGIAIVQVKKRAKVVKLTPENKAKAMKRKLKKVPRKKTTDKKKPK